MIRLILVALLVSAPAAAQSVDYAQRGRDLAALAGAFGELHHVRRMCEPRREADVWRDRMKRLIDLEQPTPQLRQEMVSAFNSGYRGAQSRFDRCDDGAEDYAAGRASEAGATVNRLAAPLYAAARPDDDPGVNVWPERD